MNYKMFPFALYLAILLLAIITIIHILRKINVSPTEVIQVFLHASEIR
jgi:hypothetical protein